VPGSPLILRPLSSSSRRRRDSRDAKWAPFFVPIVDGREVAFRPRLHRPRTGLHPCPHARNVTASRAGLCVERSHPSTPVQRFPAFIAASRPGTRLCRFQGDGRNAAGHRCHSRSAGSDTHIMATCLPARRQPVTMRSDRIWASPRLVITCMASGDDCRTGPPRPSIRIHLRRGPFRPRGCR